MFLFLGGIVKEGLYAGSEWGWVNLKGAKKERSLMFSFKHSNWSGGQTAHWKFHEAKNGI